MEKSMLQHPLIDQLQTLRLRGMAAALTHQLYPMSPT